MDVGSRYTVIDNVRDFRLLGVMMVNFVLAHDEYAALESACHLLRYLRHLLSFLGVQGRTLRNVDHPWREVANRVVKK